MNETPAVNTPPVTDDEMKMPEEDFGAPEAEGGRSKALLFTLIGILAVLLMILGAMLLWGDAIMRMMGSTDGNAPMSPEGTMNDLQPEPAASTEPTVEEDLAEIEEDLESTDFEEFDAELDAIEAEFESEATAEAQ